ncbi:hypothetical protein SAY87_027632 [Trapa incisa]|uniref:Amino acid transporter transmembrane domain-containing protein n=1 Tax=Trapa incisa TaxID=236973 RepID=A0AAN7PKF6_9MYRT|nr:hypothetical protein SAY87_027632 [Trapa incisa]
MGLRPRPISSTSVNGLFVAQDSCKHHRAFLQTVISLHIFASPMYEYMDRRSCVKGSAPKPKNLSFRILFRGSYLNIDTLVSALLPFLGDFEILRGGGGAISRFLLTFILANHMYLRAKKNKLTLTLAKYYGWKILVELKKEKCLG